MAHTATDADRPQQLNSMLTGGGIVAAGLFAAFAAFATPVLVEIAKRTNFEIAAHASILYQWGAGQVIAVAATAITAFALKDHLLTSKRNR